MEGGVGQAGRELKRFRLWVLWGGQGHVHREGAAEAAPVAEVGGACGVHAVLGRENVGRKAMTGGEAVEVGRGESRSSVRGVRGGLGVGEVRRAVIHNAAAGLWTWGWQLGGQLLLLLLLPQPLLLLLQLLLLLP